MVHNYNVKRFRARARSCTAELFRQPVHRLAGVIADPSPSPGLRRRHLHLTCAAPGARCR